MTQRNKDRWADFFRHNLLTLLSMAGGLLAMMHWGDVTFINFTHHLNDLDKAVIGVKSDVNGVKRDVSEVKKEIGVILLEQHDDSILHRGRYHRYIQHKQGWVIFHKATPTSTPTIEPYITHNK